MTHQIISKREVPATETHTSLTGKTCTQTLVHGGEKAVCVRIENGNMAWGFASTWELAEAAAIELAAAA